MVKQRMRTGTGRQLALTSLAALAAALASSAAHAQAAPSYNAPDPTLVSGNVTWVRGGAPTDIYTVNSATAVLDFVPTDATVSNGVPINFQRAGSSAIYTNPSGNDFTVLNRIVPNDTTRPITFNGTVTSQIVDPLSGAISRGGSVWFYSPAGFVLSGTAMFNVGNLLLTSADPSVSGTITSTLSNTALNSAFGNGQVTLQSGAQINASKAGSYIALVAPVINQGGTVTVNGSAAYVAAEQATLSFSGGLFSIDVAVGSNGGTIAPNQPLIHGGSSQGPSNIVNADNHGIYMVAVPKNAAITAIISPNGQLGFDVAGSASVQNGQVILSAGRNIVNGVIDDGTRPSAQRADIAIGAGSGGDGHFTSNVNARATDMAEVRVTAGQTTRFDQGLTLVGGFRSDIDLQPGGAFQAAGGNVRVQAISGTSTGGNAFARSGVGATFSVTNDLTVRADKIGISLSGPATPDATTGGSATIQSNGGSLSAGTATAAATVSGDGSQTLTGGVAQFTALNGGPLTIGGAVTVDARILRTGATSGAGGNSTAGTAFVRAFNSTMSINGDFNVLADITAGSGTTGGRSLGATARVDIDNGTLTVNGAFNVSAKAIGGAGTVSGGDATGFTAIVDISANGGSVTAGNTTIDASATAGSGGAGAGGAATGGSATATIAAPSGSGPTPQMSFGSLALSAAATGGNGTGGAGGNATGGSASVSIASATSFAASSTVTQTAEAFGGLSSGTAAAGSATGGTASFLDYGTANLSSLVLIGRATGGTKTTGTGNGGNAIGGNAFITGDTGGQLVATGTVSLDTSTFGGSVTAGTGQGGSATSLGISINALGGAHLTLHDVSATSNATAGASRGVDTASDGNAAPATVYLLQNGGGRLDVTTSVTASANGTGGAITAGIGTGTAGAGLGGDVRFVSNDGTITAGGSVTLNAKGQGGSSSGGARGGDGTGGNTNIGADAVLTSVTGDARLDSSGTGGDQLSGVGSGGNGSAGSVFVSAIGVGQITLGGNVISLTGNGTGGAAIGTGQTGGIGTGGNVQLYTLGGTVQATAAGGTTSLTANANSGAKLDATAGTAGAANGGGASVLTLGGTVSFAGNVNVYAGAYSSNTTGTAASEGILTGGTATVSTLNTGGGGAISANGYTFIYGGASRVTNTLFGNSAATTGGSATIVANTGTITLGNNVSVEAPASSYDSGASTTPATVTGGAVQVHAAGGDITLGDGVVLIADGSATSVNTLGRGIGLTGQGGTIDVSADVGQRLTTGSLTAYAGGGGGTNYDAGNGIAGTGTGGSITITADGSITMNGAIGLDARGFGGNKTIGTTGGGGDGFGGSIRVRANDSDLTINGDLTIDASGNGGDIFSSTVAGNGGNGTGGGARLDTVGVNSVVTVNGNVTIKAEGNGGLGLGLGNVGGIGTGGTTDPVNGPFDNGAYLVANGGEIDISGDALLSTIGTGGRGATGGLGQGGVSNILGLVGTVRLTGSTSTATVDASGVGGSSFIIATTYGGGSGGNGIGGFSVVAAAASDDGPSLLDIPTITAIASGTGGAGTPGLSGATGARGGNGGNGTGGTVQVIAQAGNGELSSHILTATAVGQGGAAGIGGNTNTDPAPGGDGGTGGDGSGGLVTVGLLSGPDTIDSIGSFHPDSVTTTVDGRGGAGGNGGTGGPIPFYDSMGHLVGYEHIGGTGGNGGAGAGGAGELRAHGGPVTIGDVTMNAIGQGGDVGFGNGDAIGNGIGGRGDGGLNSIIVSNRMDRTERGSLTVFSLNSDVSGHYGNTAGSLFGTSSGGTQVSVTSGDASIDYLQYQTDGFDFPAPGKETSFAIDDGTLTTQQTFMNAIGDVSINLSPTGRFETGGLQIYTNGALLFANPNDPVAVGNLVIDNDFHLQVGGGFSVGVPLTVGGGLFLYGGDLQLTDVTAGGDVSLHGYFSVTTGNIASGGSISLQTDNSGGSSTISAGALAADTDVTVDASGGNVVVGNVTAGRNIRLESTNAIQAATLSADGSITVKSDSGPIVIGDATGFDITVFTDDDNGTALDVTTGNLLATSGAIQAASYGGALTTGSVNAIGGIQLFATNALTAGNVTSSTDGVTVRSDDGTITIGNARAGDGIDVHASNQINAGTLTAATTGGGVDGVIQLATDSGSIAVGDATGGAIAFTSGLNVAAGALTARNVEATAAGTFTAGNIRVLDTIASARPSQQALAISAVGNVALGNVTSDRLIGLVSSGGSLTTGSLTTTTSIAGFAARDITIGGATTATGAAGSLFLSNASILTSNPAFAQLNPLHATNTFNTATLATANAVAVGGSITATGAVTTGNLVAAATGPLRLAAINVTSRFAPSTGSSFTAGAITTPLAVALTNSGDITTGAIDAADVLLVSTGGNVGMGAVRSGNNVIALASGSIALGGATTGLVTGPGALYLANASQRSLINGSDRSALLAAAPVAAGGSIQIAGPVTTGNVSVATATTLTAQGPITSSNLVTLTSTGLATISGAITAPSIYVTSSDIALTGSLTATSANTLRLIARGGSAGVRFGGDGTGGGYNLSGAELALLHSPNISLEADGDAIIGAATLNGSAAGSGANLMGSTGKLGILSPGTIRVTGAFQLNNMASGNRLTLNATKRVEVVTDLGGSLTLLSGTAADALGGTLELIGNNIAVGNNSLLSQLATNPHFTGRDAALAAAAAAAKPAGYLQANRIELAGVDTILIQNSGTNAAYAGFTAGAGGMEVRTALGGATSIATPADLYIFGRVQGTSAFLTGPDTRSGITFTKTANTAGFSTTSAVNTCLIPDGTCPSTSLPPEVAMILPNIVTAGQGPIIINVDAAELTTPALRLGPGLDQSALTIQTLLQEPVSSGGNPSFWIGGADAGEGNQELVTGTGNNLLRDSTTGTGNEAIRQPGAGTGTGNGNGVGNAETRAGNGNTADDAGTGTGNGNDATDGGTNGNNADNEAVTGTGNGTSNDAAGGPGTGSRNQSQGQRRRGNRRQR